MVCSKKGQKTTYDSFSLSKHGSVWDAILDLMYTNEIETQKM